MPDPQKHAANKTLIEKIVGWIPGFHGYLEKESRRESDALARKWLSERLVKSKPSLDRLIKDLATSGKLAEINKFETVRTRLDLLVGKIESAPAGYSGFFDFVKVDEAMLDRVYEHDINLVKSVESLAASIEQLSGSGNTAEGLDSVTTQIDQTLNEFDKRRQILEGID